MTLTVAVRQQDDVLRLRGVLRKRGAAKRSPFRRYHAADAAAKADATACRRARGARRFLAARKNAFVLQCGRRARRGAARAARRGRRAQRVRLVVDAAFIVVVLDLVAYVVGQKWPLFGFRLPAIERTIVRRLLTSDEQTFARALYSRQILRSTSRRGSFAHLM